MQNMPKLRILPIYKPIGASTLSNFKIDGRRRPYTVGGTVAGAPNLISCNSRQRVYVRGGTGDDKSQVVRTIFLAATSCGG